MVNKQGEACNCRGLLQGRMPGHHQAGRGKPKGNSETSLNSGDAAEILGKPRQCAVPERKELQRKNSGRGDLLQYSAE